MIRTILDIYILILIIDVILSFLPQFRNYPAAVFIKKAADFTCKPVRNALKQIVPNEIPFDFSPLVVILGIKMLQLLW